MGQSAAACRRRFFCPIRAGTAKWHSASRLSFAIMEFLFGTVKPTLSLPSNGMMKSAGLRIGAIGFSLSFRHTRYDPNGSNAKISTLFGPPGTRIESCRFITALAIPPGCRGLSMIPKRLISSTISTRAAVHSCARGAWALIPQNNLRRKKANCQSRYHLTLWWPQTSPDSKYRAGRARL